MRLSTQKKQDLIENQANAKKLPIPSFAEREKKRKLRNKRKGVVYSFATDHKKPSKKKNKAFVTPMDIFNYFFDGTHYRCYKYSQEIGVRKYSLESNAVKFCNRANINIK